jgi:tRNA(Ile)-lysidine synthase
MSRFLLRVMRTIERHTLLRTGDRVLVAYSGGPDSTALLFALIDLAPRLGVELAGLAHVHHGLRGADADADLAFCQTMAEGLGLPWQATLVDTRGEAASRRWSFERTAHLLRHAALRQTARELGANRIALGHTRDDQAETVVLRFLRGAGTRGMAGMWPRKGPVIRPLLDLSRAEVEQFLRERGLMFREDDSNADRRIPRNRVRHEVLPALEAIAGPGLRARLARQADGWRADEQWLAESVAPWVERTLEQTPSGWRVRLDVLQVTPEALRPRIRHEWLRVLMAGGGSRTLLDQLERLERMRGGGRGRLGSWLVRHDGPVLEFTLAGEPDVHAGHPVGGQGAWGPLELLVPGTVSLEGPIDRVTAEVGPRDMSENPARLGRDRAMLEADAVPARLMVRSWRPGDRLRPIGAGGSQKVQDLFVNRKVPRHARSTVPIVTTPDGHIVWVAGFAVDEDFAVQTSTTRVVTLKATRPGGKA